MQWVFTKCGKIVTCFLLTCVIYFSITSVYKEICNKVNRENEENKAKSLVFLIDR